MATPIDRGQKAACAAALSPAAPIEKYEYAEYDRYVGTPDQLVAAGLIRQDQVPTRSGCVNYINGQRHTARSQFPRREGWIQVRKLAGGLCGVRVALSDVEIEKRRAEAAARARVERDAMATQEERSRRAARAQSARETLARVPRSRDAFLRGVVHELRWLARLTLERIPASAQHGYALAPESLEAALMSLDAVVEQVMHSVVVLDHASHVDCIHRLHAEIAQGDMALAAKVAQLGVAVPTLLAGEVAP